MRTRGVCSVAGCGRARHSHGLCSTHSRQQAAGKPLTAIHPYGVTPDECPVCEDAAWLIGMGEHPEHAAGRLGYRLHSLHHHLRRHDQDELATLVAKALHQARKATA